MAGVMERGLTRYPAKVVEQAKVLFAQGVSPYQIAKQLDISSDVVVRRWCDESYRLKANEKAKLKARCELA
jgi:hypothetical protein